MKKSLNNILVVGNECLEKAGGKEQCLTTKDDVY